MDANKIECMNTDKCRKDAAPAKRVELHCHTKMSEMDGVSDVEKLMERAAAWGHKALAVTDHGVVQAFPAAYRALRHIRKEHPDFKVIYGLEGKLVDDSVGIVSNSKGQPLDGLFVVFDVETTGFSATRDRIITIVAVKVFKGEIIDRFSTFVNPEITIPEWIVELTSITDTMIADAPLIADVLPEFLRFCEGAVLVAYNADFVMGFLRQNVANLGIEKDFTSLCVMKLAMAMLPEIKRFKLENVAKTLNISLAHCSIVMGYAECAAQIFLKLLDRLNLYDDNLDALEEFGRKSMDIFDRLRSNHVTILIQNEEGRVNLYRLVSESHIHYLLRGIPRIPRSLLEEYRSGLLIGSACESGALYQAIIREKCEDELLSIASFYDFLEIQPIENHAFLIDDDYFSSINSKEDLIAVNQKIVSLGEKLHKPVVATGDVHFLDPEDEIYRQIITYADGFTGTDNGGSLYLRNTEEMLTEFSYLSPEKAYEVVVTNSNLIADMIDDIAPVPHDKCMSVMEDSDAALKELCYERVHALYGDMLPEIVERRLKRELDAVIGNGYSSLYMIVQKLVNKSLQEGCLVGSRGCVGASFAAYAAGITEVNPLPPHYLCPKCHYSVFEGKVVVSHRDGCGKDLPNKKCPVCGDELNKEGFDIPFEVFMGFHGDKEPDIDLNFSREIQGDIHKYAEEIFGKGYCVRVGTIHTIEEKTAYGYVNKYLEEKGIKKSGEEIERLADGLQNIKCGTGQHPGRLLILPKGEEINRFTPIQYPANDDKSPFVTTHFESHSIDHNLLHLDLLGHDDPTMLRLLKDYTGFDPKDVPFDDPKVMALFRGTDVLGITSEHIGGTEVGCLGIPEFGTDFFMHMVKDAKPESFSDLIRISGLCHGTGVWDGNAKELITSGLATLSSCICCRDDIMEYLLRMGLEREESFRIMEAVRMGRVVRNKALEWPAWKADMQDHGVPNWYIRSCEKIAYLFPRAHVAGYVMMAWRIAYYKIYYPQAFYTAWFTMRDGTLKSRTLALRDKMLRGAEVLKEHLKDFRTKEFLSQSEENEYAALRIAEEMYARGIEIAPIDSNPVDSAAF